MKRFMLGVLVGMLLVAGLAVAGQKAVKAYTDTLSIWKGEGARPGLYRSQPNLWAPNSDIVWFECKRVSETRITPPPSRP
jgi:hypothetical protein